MFITRFVSGGESNPAAKRAVRDELFATKCESIAAIRSSGYKPGPRILDNGVTVRLAYKPAKQAKA